MLIELTERTQSLTILEILSLAISCLNCAGIDDSRLESEIIISHVLGVEKIDLYLNNRILVRNDIKKIISLINRRTTYEPISYIVGHKEFWSIELKVNNNVLIPRPETECLVQSVIPFLSNHSSMKILDMGTGSGAIILAIANEMPWHKFYASDISYDAICLAKQNACTYKLESRINFFVSYWTDALKSNLDNFDLIISNPPYIKSDDLAWLQPEVSFYEPYIALNGGKDGLNCFRKIIEKSSLYLRKGGLLALEIGWDQKEKIEEIAKLCGAYSNIKVMKDYSGFNRVIHITKE